MDWNVPTIVIDPLVLSREGLRRVLQDARFPLIWCSDAAPTEGCGLDASASPLVIVNANLEAAVISTNEIKRLYPTARVVLLVDPERRLI